MVGVMWRCLCQAKLKWLKEVLGLELPHGVSSPDASRRVRAVLDAEQFQTCSVNWFQTVDALHCQTQTVEATLEKQADYVLPTKENQPRLLQALQGLFDDAQEMHWVECDSFRTVSAVRSNWGIENEVNWVLDITFREDDCRIRRGNGAEKLTVLRHIALNLLKREDSAKRSVKAKRKKAAWDDDYLLMVLNG